MSPGYNILKNRNHALICCVMIIDKFLKKTGVNPRYSHWFQKKRIYPPCTTSVRRRYTMKKLLEQIDYYTYLPTTCRRSPCCTTY